MILPNDSIFANMGSFGKIINILLPVFGIFGIGSREYLSKIRRLSGLSRHSPSHFGQWKRCQNRLCPRIMRSCGQFPAGTVSEFPNRPMCPNKRPGKRLILDNYWRRARYCSKLTTDASLPARFAPSVHYLAPASCISSPSALYLVPATSATVFSLAITYLFLKK